ncbi:MAG: nuclear transport factor 2 family protein, partial [Dehalococcoidia bacterium]|nr:nuclear transport factor 2 family protein [Dehalococcoidia bacterium]
MIGAIIGKRLVRSQYNLLNQRDIQTFMEGVDEDASFSYPGIVSVSGEIKGKKDMEEWFHKYIEHFPKLNIALKNIFVANIFAMGS